MSQVKAGAAYVELTTRNARFLAGLAAAQRRLTDFGQSARLLGSLIAAAGGAAALPLALSARTFMAFDDQMRAVGAVTQAAESDLAALTAEAKRLGATTSYSASEVAGLMTELGRAGFNPGQIIDMTAAVMNLARATGTDATLSAGIMAATIRQFGLAASDATRVADGLTQAANASFTSVEGLGESLQYAGPVAADANMSLEETLAILGTLGNVGIQGSEAGTALRRLLTLSAAEAKRFGDQFGVATADASGNLRPLVEILGDVATATQNLPSAERGKRFAAAFGLLGVTAASSIGKAAGDTRELLASIQNAEGVASETAQKMESGVGGAFRIMLSSLEGVAIAIGEAIEKPLRQMMAVVSTVLSVTIEWIEKNQDAVVSFAASALALVAVGAAIFATGTAFAATGAAIAGISTTLAFVGGMFGALTSIVAGLLSPIGLVSVAVVGLGGYLLNASNIGVTALAKLGEFFNGLWEDVSFAMDAIVAAISAGNISGAVEVLWATLQLQWVKGTTALTEIWVGFRDFMASVAQSMITDIASRLSNGWASVEVAWVETIDFLVDSWALFTDTLTRTWHSSIGFIEKAWVRLKGLVSDDVDVQAEITRIDSRTANANQAAASDLSNRIADRAAQRATRRRDIEANRTGRADILDQMAATDTAARRDRSKAQIDAAASNLTAARQAQLRAATLATIPQGGLTDKKPEKKSGKTLAEQVAEKFKQMSEAIAAGTNAAKASGDTAATFNAAAARGLGADTIASQQLTALNRIATATEKTADGIAEGDLYE